jgi:hypothetical protein
MVAILVGRARAAEAALDVRPVVRVRLGRRRRIALARQLADRLLCRSVLAGPGTGDMIRVGPRPRGPGLASPRGMPDSTASDAPAIISRDELQAKIDRGDAFHLFEVLPTMYWRKHHLPGAKSLPPEQVTALVPQWVPDRAAEIVVYCWDDG